MDLFLCINKYVYNIFLCVIDMCIVVLEIMEQ